MRRKLRKSNVKPVVVWKYAKKVLHNVTAQLTKVNDNEPLPELKNGDRLVSPTGLVATVVVVRSRKVKRTLEFDEPACRLRYDAHLDAHGFIHPTITGNAVFTLDSLREAGMRVVAK